MIHPFNILTPDCKIYVKSNRTYVPIEGVDYPVVTFTVCFHDYDETLISESVVPDLSAVWRLVEAALVGGEEE